MAKRSRAREVALQLLFQRDHNPSVARAAQEGFVHDRLRDGVLEALCLSLHDGVVLHLHTTHSDGTYTPAELVDLARRSGLAAVALTDHDTLGGVAVAQAAAIGTGVEIVPGVEITAEYRERELHLLGYFVRQDDDP